MYKKDLYQQKFESLIAKDGLYKLQVKGDWSIIQTDVIEPAYIRFDLLSYYKADNSEPFDNFKDVSLIFRINYFNYVNINRAEIPVKTSVKNVVFIGIKEWESEKIAMEERAGTAFVDPKPNPYHINSSGSIKPFYDTFYMETIEKKDLPLYLNNASSKLLEILKH